MSQPKGYQPLPQEEEISSYEKLQQINKFVESSIFNDQHAGALMKGYEDSDLAMKIDMNHKKIHELASKITQPILPIPSSFADVVSAAGKQPTIGGRITSFFSNLRKLILPTAEEKQQQQMQQLIHQTYQDVQKEKERLGSAQAAPANAPSIPSVGVGNSVEAVRVVAKKEPGVSHKESDDVDIDLTQPDSQQNETHVAQPPGAVAQSAEETARKDSDKKEEGKKDDDKSQWEDIKL